MALTLFLQLHEVYMSGITLYCLFKSNYSQNFDISLQYLIFLTDLSNSFPTSNIQMYICSGLVNTTNMIVSLEHACVSHVTWKLLHHRCSSNTLNHRSISKLFKIVVSIKLLLYWISP